MTTQKKIEMNVNTNITQDKSQKLKFDVQGPAELRKKHVVSSSKNCVRKKACFKEFQLTGFSMPGKPGIICLEGSERNVNEAWSVIKSWNWKKINVRLQEGGNSEVHASRRFASFEEIGFVKGGETRDHHMDMGEFHKYLEQHDCGYIFKELFGV